VIALPLAAGMALRTVWSPQDDAVIRLVTVLALLLLLWQVASQIRLDSAYVAVIAALVIYVAGSAALGWVLALRAPAGQATAVLLPVGLRGVAVAAGIATAAFGPAAAAPLGAYGVLVLLFGSLTATIARRPPGREYDVDASFMQFLRHGGGNHVVRVGARRSHRPPRRPVRP